MQQAVLALVLVGSLLMARGPGNAVREAPRSVQGGPRSSLARVEPNDNTVPAGTLRNDSLFVRLEVRRGEWRPEADSGPVLQVEALAEEGKAPQIPGPLLRVPEGTTVVATVTNHLADSTVILRGFVARPSPRDSVPVLPGETRTVTFPAGVPGTYLYRVRIGNVADAVERDLTAGAFVVDPRGAHASDRVSDRVSDRASDRASDRIMVINIWGAPRDSGAYDNALAINGRSWPYTEQLAATVGDTLHWRVVNASRRPHPMHLHGAYFRVESKGHIWVDTTFGRDRQREVVTEVLLGGQTMRMSWAPVKPGRWIFHCHLVFHVVAPIARAGTSPTDLHQAHAEDPRLHMAGLVVGIDARLPAGARVPPRGRARTLDLYVQEGARRTRAARAMSFVLQEGGRAPAPDSLVLPGSLLVLTRGQPTDVRIHNRLREATSVHWHGLELESYSDGVAGWGGVDGGRPSPSVPPGGHFTARLTTPRAGTFIYHTHLRDIEQLTSGLYGPLIVLEPGERFDARTDHVHILGWDSAEDSAQALVNGDSVRGPPIAMRVGEAHRFRFINIGPAEAFAFTIRRDSALAEWVPLAKDGATLPAALRAAQPARVRVDVGETYDFTFTPRAPGEYVLSTVTTPTGRLWRRVLVVSP